MPVPPTATARRRSQADRPGDEAAHVEIIAATLAPEPGAGLPTMPPALRGKAARLYLHLRSCGRSAQRAAHLAGYLYGVAPETVSNWARARLAAFN